MTATVATAILVALTGLIITVNTARANHAAADAAAQARQEADEAAAAARAQEREEHAEALEEHADALAEAGSALEAGEARYAESETYGDANLRENLGTALEELAAVLAMSEPTTDDLVDATRTVRGLTGQVGTAEQAAAKREAEEAAALDERYRVRAAELAANGMTSSRTGRDYCDYLHEHYTPDNVYPDLWGDRIEARQVDVAAVEIYCPEFAPALQIVLSGFYDGNHVVGKDFPAGVYRTAGGVTDCYWERNDGSGNIIANDFVTAAHNGLTVTLYEGEGFVTEGCRLWVPAG